MFEEETGRKKSPQSEASSCPNVHCQYMHIMTSNHPLEMDIAQKHQAFRSTWTGVIEFHFTRGFCFHCCLDGQNCSLSHNKKKHGYELGFCQRRGFEGARVCVAWGSSPRHPTQGAQTRERPVNFNQCQFQKLCSPLALRD